MSIGGRTRSPGPMVGPDEERRGARSGAVNAQRTIAVGGSLKKRLVRVENVVRYFPVGGGLFGHSICHAVDGVSLAIPAGETLGLVGESGCGKSTLGRVIVQLQPATSGHVFFKDVDLTRVRGEKLRRTRQQIQMIFQDPSASLNPRTPVAPILPVPRLNFPAPRRRN